MTRPELPLDYATPPTRRRMSPWVWVAASVMVAALLLSAWVVSRVRAMQQQQAAMAALQAARAALAASAATRPATAPAAAPTTGPAAP